MTGPRWRLTCADCPAWCTTDDPEVVDLFGKAHYRTNIEATYEPLDFSRQCLERCQFMADLEAGRASGGGEGVTTDADD